MKTVYTDNYGALPWVWAALGIWWVASGFFRATGWWAAADIAIGLIAIGLAVREFGRRRVASREGRDPSIIRVKTDD